MLLCMVISLYWLKVLMFKVVMFEIVLGVSLNVISLL